MPIDQKIKRNKFWVVTHFEFHGQPPHFTWQATMNAKMKPASHRMMATGAMRSHQNPLRP
jgi:hypothetical protein